eukprot:TRINITY_DN647_c0_g2_i1.p1 TRINITY_DN647_c0_g2~~TRINITY_DN647_c0_g2_i1.p1  ORF type:complete len:357 (-),score=34.47 TRINITY_DN647_c0_g2_i1:108-1136(-)
MVGNNWVRPDWSYFWSLLSAVVSICDTKKKKSADGAIPFNEQDQKFLLQRPFLTSMLKEATSPYTTEAIVGIVNHWAEGNKPFTDTIIGLIMLGIEQSSYKNMEPFFAIMEGLVSIEDKITPFRVNTILSSFVNVIETSRKYWKDTLWCLEELIVLGADSVPCSQWLKEKSQSTLKWVLPWLDKYQRAPSAYSHGASEGERLELQKRSHQRSGDDYYMNSSYSSTVPGKLRSVERKREALQAIFEGKPLDEDIRDLLAKGFKISKKSAVDFRSVTGVWQEAQVRNTNPETATVELATHSGEVLHLHERSDRLAPHQSQSTKNYHHSSADYQQQYYGHNTGTV